MVFLSYNRAILIGFIWESAEYLARVWIPVGKVCVMNFLFVIERKVDDAHLWRE